KISWFRWISFDYHVTLGVGSVVDGLDPINPVIRLLIKHGISSGIRDGIWAWPTDWLIKYPMISNMNAPVLTGSDDYIVLRNHSNIDVRFSVATIWDCIRPRNAKVNWFHIV
ncbi:hypothetical protein Tco_1454856, partial [Tanacetum coccineum]